MKTTLVLDPALAFTDLSRRYADDGWRLASQAERPILPGEPEFAVFERSDERVVYTFNPVCFLRVLDCNGADVADLPEVPVVGVDTVSQWLDSDDERTVLRGILAGGQLRDAASVLAPRIEVHRDHPRQAIADAAVQVAATLADRRADDELQAQAHALAAIAVLEQELRPVLRQFAQADAAELMEALRPRPDDYALAFEPDVADAARAAYEAYWESPPPVAPAAAHSELEVHVAPAGMLGYENHLSRPFPGGYRPIAHLLQPQRVWVAWKLVEPSHTAGVAYDGLVWLGDHWAWFPKPYRVLRDLA